MCRLHAPDVMAAVRPIAAGHSAPPLFWPQVIEYCKYHHKAEAESLPEDEKNTWDKDFVKVDDETLFNLILAANYLDIKPLLDLTCADPACQTMVAPWLTRLSRARRRPPPGWLGLSLDGLGLFRARNG